MAQSAAPHQKAGNQVSFVTVYVIMPEDGSKVMEMALSTSPDEAMREFRWASVSGPVYAAKVSESMAAEVRNELKVGHGEKAAQLLKRFSTAIQRCGDV